MKSEIKGNTLFLLIDRSIYNEDVLHKCFYWYTSNFNIEIENHAENYFSVTLKLKNKNLDLQSIIEKIQQDLIDFKLRDIVTKETKTIRELIVAKAFAYYELEEYPLTEITDPVGYNPDDIK